MNYDHIREQTLGFLHSIAAAPHDPRNYLVYADYLEEYDPLRSLEDQHYWEVGSNLAGMIRLSVLSSEDRARQRFGDECPDCGGYSFEHDPVNPRGKGICRWRKIHEEYDTAQGAFRRDFPCDRLIGVNIKFGLIDTVRCGYVGYECDTTIVRTCLLHPVTSLAVVMPVDEPDGDVSRFRDTCPVLKKLVTVRYPAPPLQGETRAIYRFDPFSMHVAQALY